MADWYVSSTKYATVAAWQATHAYAIGDLVKPVAPALHREYVFRCTTAGTSSGTEPTWSTATGNNATRTDGATLVWTNVTSQSAYGWNAAAGTLDCIASGLGINRTAVGDRVFLSSDHTETWAFNQTLGFNNGTSAHGLIQIISVNKAGSVPPVAADITNGASLLSENSTTRSAEFDAHCNLFWQGITFGEAAGGSSNYTFNLNSTIPSKSHYFKNCAFSFLSTGSSRLQNSTGSTKAIFDNCTFQAGSTTSFIGNASASMFELLWINTASAILGATLPATLFGTSGGPNLITCRGVDLSPITGTLLTPSSSGPVQKVLLDSCKVAPGVVRYGTPAAGTNAQDEVELVNCHDGSNVLNERYTPAGVIVTDRNTYLNGGAQDDVGAYSLKLQSASRPDKLTMPLDCFAFDVENTVVGSSKTAVVEFTSAAVLNDDDISLLLEYMGTSGNSIASFGNSLPATLTAGAALPSSSVSWVGASFPTWNPLDLLSMTLSNSNLTANNTAASAWVRATNGVSTGKYYFEVAFVGGSFFIGLVKDGVTPSGSLNAIGANAGGSIQLNGGVAGTCTSASPYCFAVDLIANLIWIRGGVAGFWNSNVTTSNNPATGVGGISFASVAGGPLFPYFLTALAGYTATANFGASAFGGAVPSGFTPGLPGMPINKQKLQVPFTPRRPGRVRGLVKLGRPSMSAWVNPQLSIV